MALFYASTSTLLWWTDHMEITLENLKIGNILKQYELSKILHTIFIRNIEVDGSFSVGNGSTIGSVVVCWLTSNGN